MADKGFEIKVLIPTDDGLTISENHFEDAMYFLMYNVSNRSYQLAGKLKQSELGKWNLDTVLKKEGVDCIISNKVIQSVDIKLLETELTEISQILNNLIDQIDQKNEFTL